MPYTFPNESANYRTAREALLSAEVDLRQQIERVAEMRRALPAGGAPPSDYALTSLNGDLVHLSGMFGDKQALAVYSFMYKPSDASPCPMCTSMLDSLNAQAPHIEQRVALAVVAAAAPDQLANFAKSRGWANLRLYSTQNTTYQSDYLAETDDGSQLPMMNVFEKTEAGIRHFWGSEQFFAVKNGQARHVDAIWPLWNLFDLTRAGRGADWYPALSY